LVHIAFLRFRWCSNFTKMKRSARLANTTAANTTTSSVNSASTSTKSSSIIKKGTAESSSRSNSKTQVQKSNALKKPKTSKKNQNSNGEQQDDDGEEAVSPYFSVKVPTATTTTSSKMIPASTLLVVDPLNKCRLGRAFFDQDCDSLCRALLGTVLARRVAETGEVLRGTIIETEAYPGGMDKASQSYLGKRIPRNEAMFMGPGTAYVYFTYGMYYCFNISCRG
jgi:hypothetical protein